MLGGRHPAGSVECVADGCEGVAAVAAGGGEVGADAAVALQGRQGAPAAADFRGELVARTAFSDPLFVAWTSKRVAKSQTRPALRFSRRARISPGWFPLVPGPGQVDRDPEGDGLVVAVAQPGQEGGVQAGAVTGAGGPDGGGRLAEGVAGLPGPGLGCRAGRVGRTVI